MAGMFPEVVFTVLGIPVRDTVVSTWAVMLIIVAGLRLLQLRAPELLEQLVGFITYTVSGVMGRSVEPYVPLLGALITFIAASNTFGSVPVFVSPTRDINTPAALAITVFFSVHYFAIREKGAWGHLKKLASPIFMLPLEIISQLSRTLSLTLRLFGNVLSTELSVAVIFSLVPLFAPLPLIGFSLLTGVLQAYIFTVLAAVYIDAALAAN